MGAWIARSPTGPVVSFPEANTREEAIATAVGAYGAEAAKRFSIEWSDDPESESFLCDFDSAVPTLSIEIDTEIVRVTKTERGKTTHVLDAVWYMCGDCYALFAQKRLAELVNRSLHAFLDKNGVTDPARRMKFKEQSGATISDLYEEIWRRWDGKSVPLVPKGGE